MWQIPFPYRDYCSGPQNVDELHAIIDHYGLEETLECLAYVIHTYYGRSAAARAIKQLGESEPVKRATHDWYMQTMQKFDVPFFVPLHAHYVKSGQRRRGRQRPKRRRPR